MKMVEQFKRRILDLAIRGKLVPQDPNDESASVLLERIREERAELVKAGKIKKDKQPSRIVIGSDGAAYEKFADGSIKDVSNELPFALPNGWAWTRLGRLTTLVTSGSRNWAQFYTPSQQAPLFLRMGNLSRDSFSLCLGDLQHVELPKDAEGTRTSVLPGDLLFSITAEIGMMALIPESFPLAYINQHTALIRFSLIQQGRYLPYVLRSTFAKHQYASRKHGLKTSFRLDSIEEVIVPLPPISEQKRIVAKIEELFAIADSLDSATDGLENAAKRLDKKILDLAIRGKLVPQDPDDEPASELVKRIATSHKSPYGNGKAAQARRAQRNDSLSAASTPLRDDPPPPFAIPNSWEWVRLGDVSKIVRGSGIKRNETSASGVQCVRYGEIYTHYSESFNKAVSFVPQTVADKCHEAKFGDVLCTLTGENEVEIAKATAYLGHEKLVIGGDLARISDHPYVPILLAYFMFSPFMISQKASVCTGGMIVHMGKAALSNLFIPLPPLAEQKRIVAKIEALRSVLKSFFM